MAGIELLLPGSVGSWTRTQRFGLVVLAVLALGALATVLVPANADTIGPLAVLIGQGAASFLVFSGSRSLTGRERIAWRLLGAAFGTAAAGVLAVGVFASVTGSVPAFSALDFIFVTGYALALAGFGSLPGITGDWAQRARLGLDGLIGAVALAMLLWVGLVETIVSQFRTAPLLDRVLGTAYPVLDVTALVMIMVVTVRRSASRFDPRLVLLGLGFITQAVADLTYLLSGIGKTFEEANPIYPLFIATTVFWVSAGMLLQRRTPLREYPDRKPRWWLLVAPYSAATVMFAVLLSHLVSSELRVSSRVLLGGALVVVVLAIVRQALAIREQVAVIELERTALVSSISHELRTPLTSIVGFLSILSENRHGIDPEERTEITAIAHDQAHHMARIVSDLITLARGDPDAFTLEIDDVDMESVTKKALASVNAAEPIEVRLTPGLRAHVDPGRIRQVLVNLVSNGVRYGGDRQLVVVRNEKSDLIIAVHDSGPGVPRKHELTIWDRFERGFHRLDSAIPGSGVGLAIVKAIAVAHGGSVGYRESEYLGGACFWIRLPGRAKEAQSPGEEAVSEATGAAILSDASAPDGG